LRILLVDKHPLIASSIAALISVREGWHFKSVFSAKVGIAELEEFAPDIAIIEIHLSDDPGLELLKQASTWPHRTRCMVLTSSNDPVVAAIALDLGAKAFVSKSDDPQRLLEAIDTIAEGGTWLPQDLVQDVARLRMNTDGKTCRLNKREFKILRSLAHGETMGEMAYRLGVSYRTVSNDCATLRDKLGAKSLPELVRIAMQRKILS